MRAQSAQSERNTSRVKCGNPSLMMPPQCTQCILPYNGEQAETDENVE